MSARPVEIIDRELAFDGYFKIIRYSLRHALFNGGMSPVLQREIFERGCSVAVLPYDPMTDEVVLIEQFRPGAIDDEGPAWLIEIVAGIIEPGETEEGVARRESVEEAGLDLIELAPICRYFVSPGGTTESCSLFVAQIDATLANGLHGLEEEGEDIKVHKLSFDLAMSWLLDGKIRSAAPIIALQWLALNRPQLRATWNDDKP